MLEPKPCYRHRKPRPSLGGCLAAVLLFAAPAGALSAQGGNAAEAGNAAEEMRTLEHLRPDVAHGELLYRPCADCHSGQHKGFEADWVPQIAGQHERVLEKELVDYRHGLRWDIRMERIASRHVFTSVQQIADVAAYAATLPIVPGSLGSGIGLAQGERLYGARCAGCHGLSAEGSNEQRIPRLAGQRFEYLLRQLHDAIEGRRPNLPPAHERLLRKLDAEQLSGLADYLARLPNASAQQQFRSGG